MLTARTTGVDRAYFADLRAREFSRLATHGDAYLDYAGSALYAESHVRAHQALLTGGLFGNPHSTHAASNASTRVMDDARKRVLEFFDADANTYAVCFTANASAAIKLVAESYPFGPDAVCLLAADNHNSVNGVREYARRAKCPVAYVPLDRDLRLYHPEALLAQHQAIGGGLFAFPAQSNFSGVRHPLSLIRTARSFGFDVLLDAASFAPGHRLSLRHHPADFVAVSFYKMFGYPTGVGALLARRDGLDRLSRPWFAGGTVEYASVRWDRHQLRALHEGFEDGTPNFLSIAALEFGFEMFERVGFDRMRAHTTLLIERLAEGLAHVKHANGRPVVTIYGPPHRLDCGNTIAFNVLDGDGRTVPYWQVERDAARASVSFRGGCFCNPGASEAAFGLDSGGSADCLSRLGADYSPERFRDCLGPDSTVGAVRASVGLANNADDVDRAIDVIAGFRR